MGRRILMILGVVVGLVVTGLLVAASIWPVINEVETGETPEYPDILPQYYTADPARVFEEAENSIESLDHWAVVNSNTSSYKLEATRETQVFGFIDDVTVWVEPVTEFVTRVRVRSASRVGKGDFGQNARNIRELFRELNDRLGAVKFDPDELEERDDSDGESDEDAENGDTADDAPPADKDAPPKEQDEPDKAEPDSPSP